MVSFDSPDIRIVELTSEERLVLLQRCFHIPEDIRRRLFSAHDGMLTLSAEQSASLRRSIDAENERITEPRVGKVLASVYNKLSANPITRKMAEKLSERSFQNIEDLQAYADKLREQHNNTPDPELGGLTPHQVAKLIYSQWDEPDCPLRINTSLSYEDVKDAPLFHNVLTLLNELMNRKNENTATTTGNLSRRVVTDLLKSFKIDSEVVKATLSISRVSNEPDVSVIWTTRIVCQQAGLVRKHRNKFIVTERGKELLLPENAGKLYHLLFMTYLRKFNIGFYDRLPDLDGLKFPMAYTLFHLNRLAYNEVDLEKVFRSIILPVVLEEVDRFAAGWNQSSWIIRVRVIEPLEFAGLLDCTWQKTKLLPEITSFKTSNLFHKLLRFEL